MNLSVQECRHAVIATAAGKNPGVENMPIANQQQIDTREREVAKLGSARKPGQEDGWSTDCSAMNSITTGGTTLLRLVQGLKNVASRTNNSRQTVITLEFRGLRVMAENAC